MMDCAQFRRMVLADPRGDNDQMRAHASSCEPCARYALELRRFEDRLERALRFEVGGPSRAARATVVPFRSRDAQPRRPPYLRRGWLAAAASILLAAALGLGVWLGSSGPTLAAAVVGHMAGEPDAWAVTRVPVPQAALIQVLEASNVRLATEAVLVTYARSCEFRGHKVPHLVVQADGGPITVMVLTHEATRETVRFDEHGYRGIIVPVPGHGSLAVLERGSGSDLHLVEQVAAQVRRAIDWT